MPETLKTPFTYFGGKSTVAHVVWQRFGDIPNYVEPFFGSGSVLLARPHDPHVETVNDLDGMICNFWRSVQHDPDAVAYHADYPAIESDLHARHAWLVRQRDSLTEMLEGNPDYYDAKIAGWWCWGMSIWIGGEFCSGNGSWVQEDGLLVNNRGTGKGIQKQRIHLGDAGQGVQKRRIHLGNAGKGVQRVSQKEGIRSWMHALSDRLRRVRVCCGDWKRVTGPSVTTLNGMCGMFLDPPYGEKAGRTKNVYAKDSLSVADECLDWCLEHGRNKLMRIALCGYVGEYEILQNHGWDAFHWKANGGMAHIGSGKGKENANKEVIWFSPHCLKDTQMSMF